MARNPRVYELAIRHGADQSVVLRVLRDLGEYVKSPSSTLVPPVARKLAAALTAEGYFAPALPKLDSAPPTLRELPHSTPSVLGALCDGDREFNRRIRLATEDRAVYYLAGPAAQQIVSTVAPIAPITLLQEKLHTRTGVLIVQPAPAEISVYAWVADDDALRFQTLRLTEAGDSPALTPSQMRSVDVPVAGGAYASAMTQFGEFCSVWELVPEREPRSATEAGTNSPIKPRIPRSYDNDVHLSTLTRSRNSQTRTEQGSRESRPATYRWMVSGHYREQPYPSLGITKRIWIAPHTAGAQDGELVEGLRVFVISPA